MKEGTDESESLTQRERSKIKTKQKKQTRKD
jgi:hypothetical protein